MSIGSYVERKDALSARVKQHELSVKNLLLSAAAQTVGIQNLGEADYRFLGAVTEYFNGLCAQAAHNPAAGVRSFVQAGDRDPVEVAPGKAIKPPSPQREVDRMLQAKEAEQRAGIDSAVDPELQPGLALERELETVQVGTATGVVKPAEGPDPFQGRAPGNGGASDPAPSTVVVPGAPDYTKLDTAAPHADFGPMSAADDEAAVDGDALTNQVATQLAKD